MKLVAVAVVALVIFVAVAAQAFRDHRCTTCGREFESADAMYRHLDRAHLS